MPRRIFLPPRLDLVGVQHLLNESDFQRDAAIDAVLIDNDVHEWIEPIGLAAVCAGVRHLRARAERPCPVNFTQPERVTYMQRMDLHRARATWRRYMD
jgi:hypothetical protein